MYMSSSISGPNLKTQTLYLNPWIILYASRFSSVHLIFYNNLYVYICMLQIIVCEAVVKLLWSKPSGPSDQIIHGCDLEVHAWTLWMGGGGAVSQ
jgi:hypothetical protein